MYSLHKIQNFIFFNFYQNLSTYENHQSPNHRRRPRPVKTSVVNIIRQKRKIWPEILNE